MKTFPKSLFGTFAHVVLSLDTTDKGNKFSAVQTNKRQLLQLSRSARRKIVIRDEEMSATKARRFLLCPSLL